MKWPRSLTLVRHGESAFNAMKKAKGNDPRYRRFEEEYQRDPESGRTQKLALQIWNDFPLKISDAQTPLTPVGERQATTTGVVLSNTTRPPKVIAVSPYLRTRETLRFLTIGWPKLAEVEVYEEERLREMEIGLRGLYHDWMIFNALYPEQRQLREQEGGYWYRLPQGENVPDLRARLHSWLGTIIREFAGEDVLAVTHHMTILGVRANLERWGEAEFTNVDHNEKPVNCGVTLYHCDPEKGRGGKLELAFYNRKYYT